MYIISCGVISLHYQDDDCLAQVLRNESRFVPLAASVSSHSTGHRHHHLLCLCFQLETDILICCIFAPNWIHTPSHTISSLPLDNSQFPRIQLENLKFTGVFHAVFHGKYNLKKGWNVRKPPRWVPSAWIPSPSFLMFFGMFNIRGSMGLSGIVNQNRLAFSHAIAFQKYVWIRGCTYQLAILLVSRDMIARCIQEGFWENQNPTEDLTTLASLHKNI